MSFAIVGADFAFAGVDFEADFAGVDFGADFAGVDFTGADFAELTFPFFLDTGVTGFFEREVDARRSGVFFGFLELEGYKMLLIVTSGIK